MIHPTWWRAGCAGGVAALTLLSGCSTVPETGRYQLLLVSPEQEVRMGISAFQEVKESLPRARDPAQNALLQAVGQRIASVVDLPEARWEFVLFDAPNTPNAFCLPGGKVGVYTGMLPLTQDADGLATVIGHEVAHAVARHGAERMSEGQLIQLGGQLLSLAVALATKGAVTRDLAHQAYGIGAELGRTLPHSRTQELEADQLGLLYMARAGYDPSQAIGFWRRFQAYKQGQGAQRIEFLSTHPLDERRIAEIERFLPKALRQYRKFEEGDTGAHPNPDGRNLPRGRKRPVSSRSSTATLQGSERAARPPRSRCPCDAEAHRALGPELRTSLTGASLCTGHPSG